MFPNRYALMVPGLSASTLARGKTDRSANKSPATIAGSEDRQARLNAAVSKQGSVMSSHIRHDVSSNASSGMYHYEDRGSTVQCATFQV